MSDNQSDQPKQRTRRGLTIPVPKRDDVIRNLKKVARPGKGSTPNRPKK